MAKRHSTATRSINLVEPPGSPEAIVDKLDALSTVDDILALVAAAGALLKEGDKPGRDLNLATLQTTLVLEMAHAQLDELRSLIDDADTVRNAATEREVHHG